MSKTLSQQNFPARCFSTIILLLHYQMALAVESSWFKIMLRQQVSHLLLKCTTVGYGTELKVACASQGCSTNHHHHHHHHHWLLLLLLCSNLWTTSLMTGIHMRDIYKQCWLIELTSRDMWADSLYFLYKMLSSMYNTLDSFQHTVHSLIKLNATVTCSY
jgi:hypothetical protein